MKIDAAKIDAIQMVGNFATRLKVVLEEERVAALKLGAIVERRGRAEAELSEAWAASTATREVADDDEE